MADRKRQVEAITIISVNAEEYMNRGEWQARPLQRGSTAALDLQNLPFDPAEVASQEHNETLKMREAGASAVPAPTREQLSPIAVMEPGMTGVLEPVREGFGDILAGVKDGWFSRSLQCWV